MFGIRSRPLHCHAPRIGVGDALAAEDVLRHREDVKELMIDVRRVLIEGRRKLVQRERAPFVVEIIVLRVRVQ
eukprot:4196730-Lingulodinium_polyedra.AAC.1